VAREWEPVRVVVPVVVMILLSREGNVNEDNVETRFTEFIFVTFPFVSGRFNMDICRIPSFVEDVRLDVLDGFFFCFCFLLGVLRMTTLSLAEEDGLVEDVVDGSD
jgi:hypothetical protein